MITSPTTRLPAKAAKITSGRVVRSMMEFPLAGSEAGRDAGGDHFEKYRGAVVEPKRERAEQHHRAKARGAPDDDRRHPALRPGCRHRARWGGNRLNHGSEI